MGRKKKIALYLAGGFVSLLIVISIAGFLVIQTPWFREQVRGRIVNEIEKASGGKTQIESFTFDWRALTAEVKGFVLHGTEPTGSPSLFRADNVKVGLKIVSIFKKDIDIALLKVDRPQVYILVKPDGTTNVPAPKRKSTSDKSAIEQILALAVQHFEINQGTIEYDSKTIPLDIRGDDLNTVMNYAMFPTRYQGKISLRQVQLSAPNVLPMLGAFETDLTISNNQLTLPSLKIGLQRSDVTATVTLTNFKDPRIEVQLKGKLFGDELGRLLKISFLKKGEVALQGKGHYESNTYEFAGTVAGRGIAIHSTALNLENTTLSSGLKITPDFLTLPKLDVSASGAKITGAAELKKWKNFRFAGNLNGLSVQQVGRLLIRRPLEWDGRASGPVEVKGSFDRRGVQGLIVKSALAILPGSDGIPLQGDVDLTYDQRRNVIELGQSKIQLPNTQLAVSGALGSLLNVNVDTTNLDDIDPALKLFSADGETQKLPVRLENGRAHFEGTLTGPWSNLEIAGDLTANQVAFENHIVDEVNTNFALNKGLLDMRSLSAQQKDLRVTGHGQLALSEWKLAENNDNNVQGQFNIQNADLTKLKEQFGAQTFPVAGIASGSVFLDGTVATPGGTINLAINNPKIYEESFDRLTLAARLKENRLEITTGQLQVGQSSIRFSGDYSHTQNSWQTGSAFVKVGSDRFPLSQLRIVHNNQPELSALLNLQAAALLNVRPDRLDLQSLDGQVAVLDIVNQGESYGNISVDAKTHNRNLEAKVTGDFRGSAMHGQGSWRLENDYPGQGEVTLSQLNIARLYSLFSPKQAGDVAFDGLVQGGAKFSGPLRKPEQLRASVKLDKIELSPILRETQRATQRNETFVLKNVEPLIIEAANQVVTLQPTKFKARDTEFSVNGTARLSPKASLDAKLDGTINLKLLEMLDSELDSTGVSVVKVSATGSLANPTVIGTIELKEATLHYADFPNGLDHANGVIRFDKNRATIQKLTAQSGGGDIKADGFVSLTDGVYFYKLEAEATNVRVRVPQGLSVSMDSALKFTGTSDSSLLSGNVTVTRASFNPSTDLGGVLAASARPVATPSAPNAFLRGVQFNVHVQSAPVLQVNTTLTQDVQGEIDLRVRGTPERPIVLGRVSISEGQLQVFGNKYTVNRGDVNFFNSTKIEPVLDVDLETVTRSITVNISVTGPLNQLNMSYRSDPPLQPSEIIALLAVGRSPNTTSGLANSQMTSGTDFITSGANTVLGQAISSPVSNRLQRFFGVSKIKIDPQLRGTESIPQARLTVEQQISKEITLTYVTNLSRTSQQIIRAEWAFTKRFSVIAIRDENGTVGLDFQYRKQLK